MTTPLTRNDIVNNSGGHDKIYHIFMIDDDHDESEGPRPSDHRPVAWDITLLTSNN
jgi:hypothetical protein